MTEKKKLKKRVRARMEETGERYTEALTQIQADDPGFEDTIVRFLNCQTPTQVEATAREFHQRHYGRTPGAERLALHALEVLMPQRLSWSTGRLTPDPSARSESAPADLRELLVQYRSNGPAPEMRNPIKTKFSKISGWLGTSPKEELTVRYEGAEDDDEFQFDPEGSPPRFHLLTPEEERVFEGIWQEAPNVDSAFGLAAPAARSPSSVNINVQGGLGSAYVFRTAHAALEQMATRKQEIVNLVVSKVEDRAKEDFIGEAVPWIAPIMEHVLSNLRGIIEQEGRNIVAFVCSSRDFADIRGLTPGNGKFGVRWEELPSGDAQLYYFNTPVWHTHEIKAGGLFAVSDDDRLVECTVTR